MVASEQKVAITQRRHARSPRLRINITRSIIVDATAKDSNHCMIAEAVKEIYPAARAVSVDLATIRFTDREKGLRYTYLTPRIAQAALVNFDQGRPPEPFSFMLRTAQVTKSGQALGHTKKKPSAAQMQSLRKATLVQRKKDGHVPDRIGGKTPPLQRSSDNVPFSRRRAFGLRALEL